MHGAQMHDKASEECHKPGHKVSEGYAKSTRRKAEANKANRRKALLGKPIACANHYKESARKQ